LFIFAARNGWFRAQELVLKSAMAVLQFEQRGGLMDAR
jgi:hypothetical protein